MEPLAYSSLTAFLAHRDALRRLSSPSAAQLAVLQSIQGLVSALDERDRAALNGAEPRRRERAERALLRILRERGVVPG